MDYGRNWVDIRKMYDFIDLGFFKFKVLDLHNPAFTFKGI
jgi:hypothetical protein